MVGDEFEKDNTVYNFGIEISYKENVPEVELNAMIDESRQKLYEGKSAGELLKYVNTKI
jgi:hypothetical protein